jgi:peptidyl-prolyl isomerase E (cyclophilin E)
MDTSKARIHVANLDASVSKEYLYSLFIPFGPIIDVALGSDSRGKFRGFADVQFENPEDAEAAIDNMEGAQVLGKTLRVKYARKETAKLNSTVPVWEQEAFLADD